MASTQNFDDSPKKEDDATTTASASPAGSPTCNSLADEKVDNEESGQQQKGFGGLANCAVCLGSLRPPIKVLPCGHSYCYRCLIGIKQSNATLGRRFIRCPTCRQETLLPRGLVKQLPTNYMLQQVLAALSLSDNPDHETVECIEEASPDIRSNVCALLIGDSAALETVVSTVFAMSTPRGDWNCPSCNYYNYSFRNYCRWCPSPSPRPRLEIGYVDDAIAFDQVHLVASISSAQTRRRQ